MPNIKQIALIALLVLFLPSVSFAHSVTMNLKFHISSNADLIRANGTTYNSTISKSFTNPIQPWISSEHPVSGALAVFGFAGTLLSEISFSSQAYPYTFSMTQDEDQNIFMIGLTSGTWRNISTAASSSRIPSRTISTAIEPQAETTSPVYLQLQLDAFDLLGSIGPGRIIIRNVGKLRLPQILLQVM